MTAAPVDTRSASEIGPAPAMLGDPRRGSTLVASQTVALVGSGGRATEKSLLPRFVALCTPLFAIAAGAMASWVARRTGAQLDSAGLTTFMVTASTSVIGASWKWLHGWQQHELLVAQGRDVPRRSGPAVDG